MSMSGDRPPYISTALPSLPIDRSPIPAHRPLPPSPLDYMRTCTLTRPFLARTHALIAPPNLDVWRYPFRLVAGATMDWCKINRLDPKRQYVWIDVLCWNQHPGRMTDPVAEWTPRVEAIGLQLTMLHPWNKPTYTTRAWCVFELWYAIRLGKKCDLSIIVAPEDRKAFHAAIVEEGYGVVDAVLEGIDAEAAEVGALIIRHRFGPSMSHSHFSLTLSQAVSSSIATATRVLCDALLGAHVYRMLTGPHGACNPILHDILILPDSTPF